MRDTTAALEASIEVLRVQVEALQVETNQLRSDLATAQQRLSFLEGRTLGSESHSSTAPPAAHLSSPVRTSTGAGYQVGVEREEACRAIGAWVRQSLAGSAHGLSGRERISQQSRYYLVFKNFDQQVFNPPLFFDNWAACAEVVKRRGQLGNSIFIGLPTKCECHLVSVAAGSIVPDEVIASGYGVGVGHSGR